MFAQAADWILMKELEAHEKTFCSRGLTIIDIFENSSLDNSSGIITTLSESLLRHQRYNAPVCVCLVCVFQINTEIPKLKQNFV